MKYPKQTDQNAALTDFVAHNPQGLTEITDQKLAEDIITALLYEGLSPAQLVTRVGYFVDSNQLLQFLAQKYEGRKEWQRFIDAVITVPVGWWSENFSRETVEELFNSFTDTEYIFENHQQTITNPSHPLFKRFQSGADEHWKRKVRWFIAHRDIRRAYDELKAAHRGFSVSQDEDETKLNRKPFRPQPKYNFCYQASDECLKLLIRELFQVMCSKGKVTELTLADLVVGSDRGSFKVYETKQLPNPRHKPRAYNASIPLPGFELACAFQIQRLPGMFTWPYHFQYEGAMVLKIAAYFSQKKSESRRSKHRQALKAYEASIGK